MYIVVMGPESMIHFICNEDCVSELNDAIASVETGDIAELLVELNIDATTLTPYKGGSYER